MSQEYEYYRIRVDVLATSYQDAERRLGGLIDVGKLDAKVLDHDPSFNLYHQAPLPGWRKLDGQEATQPVRVLLESTRPDIKGRRVRVVWDYLGNHLGKGFDEDAARALKSVGAWTPIAYRPADPLTLPPDWEPTG